MISSVSQNTSTADAQVEALEPRRMFSVTVQALDTDANGLRELVIRGDTAANRVIVYDDSANASMQVAIDSNNNGQYDVGETFFDFSGGAAFEIVDVDLKSNNDTLSYLLVSDYDGDARGLSIVLGSGNDAFTLMSPTSGPTPNGTEFDPDGADFNDGSDFGA